MTESGATRKIDVLLLGGAIVLALAYPTLLVLLAHVHSGGQDGFPLDDPWIHLTFARNLHDHGTFSYFPNTAPSGGSTAPLYTMLLAVGFLFTSNEKLLSYVIGLAAQLVFLIALAQWARYRVLGSDAGNTAGPGTKAVGRWSTLWPCLVVLLVGLDSRVGILAVSGMETSLYLALLALAFWGRASGKKLLFGLSLGTSLWVRPDSLILLVVFGIDLALARVQRKRGSRRRPKPGTSSTGSSQWSISSFLRTSPWSGLAVAAGIAVLYFAFHLILFGRALPNTFTAKTTYYQEVPRTVFLLRDLPEAFGSDGWILVSILAIAAITREVVSLMRGRSSGLRAETGWVLGLSLAYLALLPFSHRFSRYLVPALPALAILGVSTLRWMTSSGFKPLRYAAPVLAAAGLVLQSLGASSSSPEYEGICLYHWTRHERAGRWLEAHTPADAVIATHDIGAIGYYSHRRIVDLVGILDPAIVPHLGTPAYIPRVHRLLEREGVTHLAVLRNWLEVSNVDPVFIATTEPEVLEIFAWDPTTVHLVPKPASALEVRGASLLDARDLAGAQVALRNSLRFDSENSRAWYLLAISEEMGSDYENAAEHYRKTYALFPRHFDARYRESQVLLAAGRKLEGARALHALLDVKPDYPTALEQFLELRKELGSAADEITLER